MAIYVITVAVFGHIFDLCGYVCNIFRYYCYHIGYLCDLCGYFNEHYGYTAIFVAMFVLIVTVSVIFLAIFVISPILSDPSTTIVYLCQ